MWKVQSNSGVSLSYISYLSSNTKEWSTESEFHHDIDNLHGRSLHINGKLFWLGLDLDPAFVGEGYFVVCYDTYTHVSSRQDFSVPENGFCEAIISMEEKIGALYRVSNQNFEGFSFMTLWVSDRELIPSSSLVLWETFQEVPLDYKFIGSLGEMLVCAPAYCKYRGSKRDILFLFGQFSVFPRRIDGRSPRNFFINQLCY